MKTILLVLAALCFIGCNKDNEKYSVSIGNGIEFSIFDNQENDLLDPENPNAFKESEIKLFYLVNNEVIEVYDSHLDNPRHFMIYKHTNNYRIGISTNSTESEEFPITYIRWNESDTDTIKAQFYRSSSLLNLTKVWLNGELIWEFDSQTEPHVKITK